MAYYPHVLLMHHSLPFTSCTHMLWASMNILVYYGGVKPFFNCTINTEAFSINSLYFSHHLAVKTYAS